MFGMKMMWNYFRKHYEMLQFTILRYVRYNWLIGRRHYQTISIGIDYYLNLYLAMTAKLNQQTMFMKIQLQNCGVYLLQTLSFWLIGLHGVFNERHRSILVKAARKNCSIIRWLNCSADPFIRRNTVFGSLEIRNQNRPLLLCAFRSTCLALFPLSSFCWKFLGVGRPAMHSDYHSLIVAISFDANH